MQTKHTATTIDTLTTAITGKTVKRASSKNEAIRRFVAAAHAKCIDGAAILLTPDLKAASEAVTAAMTPAAEAAPEVIPHIPLRGSSKAALALLSDHAPAAPPKLVKERKPKAEPKHRGPSKIDAVVVLMKRPEGAAMTEIMAATGWLAHTARAAISAQIKKKLGLTIETSKAEGRGTIYRAA